MKLRGHLVGGAVSAGAVMAAWLMVTRREASMAWPAADALLSMARVLGLAGLVGRVLPDLDHRGRWMARRIGAWWRLAGWRLRHPVAWWWLGRHRRPGQSRWVAGRERVRVLLAHRALSHSYVGLVITLGVFGVCTALLLPLLAALLTPAALQQADALRGRVLGVAAVFARLLAERAREDGWWWSVALGAGYARHLVLDMCTVRGVRLLLPWSDAYHHVLPLSWRVTSE